MARESPTQFPLSIMAPVIKGPGRNWSKIAGRPSASIPHCAVPEEIEMEVPLAYYGFASVENGPVFKALITTLPNGKTLDDNGYATVNMEVYILNEFESDFYGKSLRIWILGRLEESEPVEPPCEACREKDLKKSCKKHSYHELQIQLLEAALEKVDSILDAPTLEEYRHHALLNHSLESP